MALLTSNIYWDFLTVTLSLIAAVVLIFKICYTHWSKKRVFHSTPSFPFGNAKDLILQKITIGLEFKRLYDFFKKNRQRFGGYYFFMRPIFVPVDLEIVKQIMTKDFAHFTDHVIHINEESDPLSVHLFSLKGAKWKSLRAKLTPTFTSGKMKMMFQTLVECSTNLTDVLEDVVAQKDAIDIKEIIARFTTDIIGSCAFGIECNSLKNPNSEFREYGKKFFDTSITDSLVRLLTLTVPEFFNVFKISSHRKDVTNFFLNVVNQTVKYREDNKVVRKDFMHLLLQIKNNVKITENDLGDVKNSMSSNDEASLTLNELAAQCFVFFIAGFETSSTTTTFCMYELSENQSLQEKLREEVNSVMNKYNGKLTYEAMMEMTYMDKCINGKLGF